MVSGSIITNNGKKIILNRAYKGTPDYEDPVKFSVGISNSTPDVADTALAVRIPIENGTVNETGETQWTGSDGGDNTTDNTTTYKEGAGASDATSQNMIANGTNATKTWTIADIDTAGTDITAARYIGFWWDIKDAATLAKFKTSGTCLEFRIRTNGDAANKYYTITKTRAQLALLWNWITSNTTLVSALTQGAGGAPSGVLDEVILIATTNNATDTFTTGDVLFDLLRTWEASDLIKTFTTSYPVFDETKHEVEIRCSLPSTKANGFLLNGFALYNDDATPLMHSEDTHTDNSKSTTDVFTYIIKDRLI